jgi:hypothetical protein
MRRCKVVVLYVHPLFGQGIGQILRSHKDLEVTCLPAGENPLKQIQRIQPRAIILEAAAGNVPWDALRDLPPTTVIRVGLDENTMDIYQDHQTVTAGPDNLVTAIHSGLRSHKPPTIAP